ncbi:MAG: hypothetical protein AB7F31_05710 [Parachlamydiales bacterium]
MDVQERPFLLNYGSKLLIGSAVFGALGLSVVVSPFSRSLNLAPAWNWRVARLTLLGMGLGTLGTVVGFFQQPSSSTPVPPSKRPLTPSKQNNQVLEQVGKAIGCIEGQTIWESAAQVAKKLKKRDRLELLMPYVRDHVLERGGPQGRDLICPLDPLFGTSPVETTEELNQVLQEIFKSKEWSGVLVLTRADSLQPYHQFLWQLKGETLREIRVGPECEWFFPGYGERMIEVLMHCPNLATLPYLSFNAVADLRQNHPAKEGYRKLATALHQRGQQLKGKG